jgi:hypothetical protein
VPRLTEESRQAIADILEVIAKDGLPGPRDLDVALDAIESSIDITFDSITPVTEIGGDEPFDTAALVRHHQ